MHLTSEVCQLAHPETPGATFYSVSIQLSHPKNFHTQYVWVGTAIMI